MKATKQKAKKFFLKAIFLLIVTVFFSSFGIGSGEFLLVANAEGEIYGSCGASNTDDVRYSLSGGTLTISGNGSMRHYSNSDDNRHPWDDYDEQITKVVFSGNVTSISAYAFLDCVNLTDVVIPGTITSIGESAFGNCTALTEISIPSSIKKINNGTFRNTSLTHFYVPYGVEEIGASAFADCTSLTSVSIPNSVTLIDDWAFSKCTALKSVVIPDSVTELGASVFSHCSALESVILGNSIKSIYSSAFYCCKSLKSITVPGSLKVMGDQIFRECTSLESAVFEYGVKKIGKSAFYGCTALTDVSIASSVTVIGECAFYGCTALEDIAIPSSVTTIDKSAFSNCTALKDVIIPEGVKSIVDSAFNACYGIESVVIPDSVTELGKHVFLSCSALQDVSLGNGISGIDEGTFYACYSLQNISIPNSVSLIGKDAFSYCTSLYSITIPDSVTTIDIRAFSNSGLVHLTLGSGVTSIDATAFNNCYKLVDICNTSSLAIEAGSTENGKVGYNARNIYTVENGASHLTYKNGVIYLSDNGTAYAMAQTGNENDVAIADSIIDYKGDTVEVTNIFTYAFYENAYMKNVSIPSGITKIGKSSFSDCTALTDVYYGDSEEIWKTISIGSNNSNLTNANIHFSEHTHKFSSVVTDPTCTEQGFTTYTCRCKNKYVDNYVNASGHTEVIDEAVAATCTADGLTEGKHCSVCNEVLVKQEVVAASGHDYVSLVTDPTCTSIGYTTYTCACGESYIGDELPFAEHTVVIDYGFAPTCTADGMTDGKHCSVCNEILSEREVITATGHIDDDKDFVCDYCDEDLPDDNVDIPDENCEHIDENQDGICDNCNYDFTSDCDHLCHKDGFVGFFWKIIRLFWKLFKMNPVCECGMAHY